MTPAHSAGLAVILALAVLAPLLGARRLMNPDEPREAEIAREAAVGQWTVVPELNGKPFLEHPPLFSPSRPTRGLRCYFAWNRSGSARRTSVSAAP